MPIPEKIIIPAAKDPGRGHFYVSLVKSVFRIGAGTALVFGNVITAGVLLITAEILGIIEEIV
jgi:hypothetical protein